MRNYRSIATNQHIRSYINKNLIPFEKEPLNVIKTTILDFIQSNHSYRCTVKGYIIFCGAYRYNEKNLLNGFIIIKEKPHIAKDGTQQTAFIAIKSIEVNEVINFGVSINRFGGTIYEIDNNILFYNAQSNDVPLQNEQYLFPIPSEKGTLFGIILYAYNDNIITNTTMLLEISQSPTDKRITTFNANHSISSVIDVISFTYTPSVNGVDAIAFYVEFI